MLALSDLSRQSAGDKMAGSFRAFNKERKHRKTLLRLFKNFRMP
jgi:hypothetical protein